MPKAALRNAATSANGGGDHTEQEGARGEPADTRRRAKTKPTSWANFSGGTGSRSVTGLEPGCHDAGEYPPVGVLARAAERADGEDDGLHAQNERRRQRADGSDDERDHQDGGGDPGGEAGSAHVHGVWSVVVLLLGTVILQDTPVAGKNGGSRPR